MTKQRREITTRLRKFEISDALGNGDFSVCMEAADMIERLSTPPVAAQAPDGEAVEGLLLHAAEHGDCYGMDDWASFLEELRHARGIPLECSVDASELARNVTSCGECGQIHDRRQACARAALAVLPVPAGDGEVERLTAAIIYAAETTTDKHTSRKLFEVLKAPATGDTQP